MAGVSKVEAAEGVGEPAQQAELADRQQRHPWLEQTPQTTARPSGSTPVFALSAQDRSGTTWRVGGNKDDGMISRAR